MIRLMCSFSKSEITDDVVTFVLQTPPVTHVNSFVESFDFNDYVPPELGSDNFAHTDRNRGDDYIFGILRSIDSIRKLGKTFGTLFQKVAMLLMSSLTYIQVF